MHILITRPEENAASLKKLLESLGHQVTIEPLIHILPIDPNHVLKSFPPSVDIVVTTSQQAIRCLAHIIRERDISLWCVGSESAKIAKELGFQNIYEAQGSAEDLIDKLLLTHKQPRTKPIIHLSGDVIRVDVVDALQRKGLAAQRVVAYNTQEAKALSKTTQTVLKDGTLNTVLFYSPRTAYIFQTLCKGAQLERYCASLTAVCLSNAIENEVQKLPWKNIRIAKKTTTDDLLNAMMMAD